MKTMKVPKGFEHSNFTFSNLALNDYESVFVIDARDNSYVEYSASDSDTQLMVHGYGEDFFLDVAENLRSQVWEEDRWHFIQTFNKTAITQAMRGGKSYSLRFRLDVGGVPLHYMIKTIRSSDHSIILGIKNIESEVQSEIANEAERIAYMEVAESMAALFDVIYHVDLASGRFAVYNSGDILAKYGMTQERLDFFAHIREDGPNAIHPDDCEAFLKTLDRDALLEALQKTAVVTLDFRQLVDGKSKNSTLIAFRQKNAERLIVGIRAMEPQSRQQGTAGESQNRIADTLTSRYDAVYYIDIVTNTFEVQCEDLTLAGLGTPAFGENFFTVSEQAIRRNIHPDDMELVLNEMKKTSLLKHLSQSETLSLTYRQILDGREQYVTARIMRPRKDMRHLIMTLLNVDAQIRHEKSQEMKDLSMHEIAGTLADRYDVLYRVNTETGSYSEYCSNEAYAKLAPGTKGKNFFSDVQRDMKREIYAEDYPMMAQAMKKEQLLENMSQTGKVFLHYRALVAGTPQYMMLFAVRPKSDSTHILVAVANVDASSHVESNLEKTAGTSTNTNVVIRDALTGVKNKHAYAQAEQDLDAQIAEKKNPDFAIVVCNINDLKSVNETKGYEAGDEDIRCACHIICDTFKHSPVYRVGGDEFAVLLKGTDFEHRKQLMQQLSIISLEHSQTGKVTLASGISVFNQVVDTRVQDVFDRADSAMFENKKRFKSAFRK